MNRKLNLLVVEDNISDVLMLEESLRTSQVAYRLEHASNGTEALSYLRGNRQDSCPPDVILMDVNMPGMNGHETLQEIREDVLLRSIPVVMLSGSQSRDDIRGSYRLQANAYISKPMSLSGYGTIVQTIASLCRLYLNETCYPVALRE